MTNDFLSDIFDLACFSEENRKQSIIQLDSLIQTQVIADLAALLPEAVLSKLQDEGNDKSLLIGKYVDIEKIKQVEQNAIGCVMLDYLYWLYTCLNMDDRQKMKMIFAKHGVRI